MAPNASIISFVSGKGGVGKTSLAANFAWICGQVKKTVLIDLDFQNQGATGLFLASLPPEAEGALEALTGPDGFASCNPIAITDNVCFVPAVTVGNPADYARMAEMMADTGLAGRLEGLLEHLRSHFGFEVMVLDCHGGLDYVSVAAHALSAQTIVVTEADPVTFNGTLELLDFYSVCRPVVARVHAMAGSGSSDPLTEEPSSAAGSRAPCGEVSFVINRLPSKYRFHDLDATYRRLIARYHGNLPLRKSVLSYIPEEGFLAESFGEYPFCIKLAPKSVVARKLQLMMIDLVTPDPDAMAHYAPLKKMRAERVRHKIRVTTLSAESRNTSNIIYAFGWMCLLFTMAVVLYFCSLILDFAGEEPGKVASGFSPFLILLFKIYIGLSLIACVYYCVRAQIGLTLYYNEKYRFRRALHRVTGGSLTIWQKLSVGRLWLLRLGVAIGPVFVTLIALVYAGILLFNLVR